MSHSRLSFHQLQHHQTISTLPKLAPHRFPTRPIAPRELYPSSIYLDTYPPPNPTMPGLNSAAGLLGLLQEPDDQLRCFALQKLDQNVDQFWAQIADSVPMM